VSAGYVTIFLHRDAPPKPPAGAPCNGCGVCCAATPCPLGRLVFLRRQGPCPALTWQEAAAGENGRYRCGLLTEPARHLHWLPRRWQAMFARAGRRWIAAGRGCDSMAAAD